jgi:hypothetical protein
MLRMTGWRPVAQFDPSIAYCSCASRDESRRVLLSLGGKARTVVRSRRYLLDAKQPGYSPWGP